MSKGASKSHSPDEIIDLHISLVPQECWIQRLNYASKDSIEETFSAGFIRIHPDRTIWSVRRDLAEQIGDHLFPAKYVFLKHVGRCLALVREKQEHELKAKHFITPGNIFPEIFILPYQPSTYNNLILPPMGKNAVASESFSTRVSSSTPVNITNKFNAEETHQDSTKNLSGTERRVGKIEAGFLEGSEDISTDKSVVPVQNISNSSDIPNFEARDKHMVRTRNSKAVHPLNEREGKAKTQTKTLRRRNNQKYVSPQLESKIPPMVTETGVAENSQSLLVKDSHGSQTQALPDKSPLPSRGHDNDLESPGPITAPIRTKSRGSLLLLTDSGFTDDYQEAKSIPKHKDRKTHENEITEGNRGEDHSLPMLGRRRVSIEEPPILVPSFVKSPVPFERKPKPAKSTAVRQSNLREAKTQIQSTTTARHPDVPTPKQRLWQDLQKVQEHRRASGQPQQHVARKTRTEIPQLSKIVTFKKNTVKRQNPKQIFQAENNATGSKCPLCFYMFHTEADRKRHIGLVHGGKVTKSVPETKRWLANVIMAASDENVNIPVPRKHEKKRAGNGSGDKIQRPIKFKT